MLIDGNVAVGGVQSHEESHWLREGATPLMNAVQRASLEKVLLLLDHGADPDARDGRGFTALHRAAEMGHLDVLRVLLDRGATPDPVTEGHTPRSLAEGGNHGDILAVLDEYMPGGS